MASRRVRFASPPESDQPSGSAPGSSKKEGILKPSWPPQPSSPPSLITPPFLTNLLREAGCDDEAAPTALNQFDMPLTPTDPALLQDLVPPPPQLLAAPRGRSASIQVGRKRTYTADADAYGGPALKAPRGRSRTRFHPSPGHAGIPRDLAQEGWHPITPTSNADARASSRAMQLASEPPTCNEEPPYWTTGPGVDPLKSIDEETIHSAPVQPCSRTEAHGNVPFYVCASCRIRAGKHREEQFFMLGHQPRSLPLCEACGTYGLTMPANPANVENGQVTKLGCTCGTDWMCYECALRDLEVAQAKYDGELEFRRNLGSVDVQGGVQYVSIETHCICGEPLKGTERAWRCTCCLGIGIS